MICKRCGKENYDLNSYCEHCGMKMNEELTSEEKELFVLSEQNQQLISELQNMVNKEKRPLWQELLITIAISLIIGIACIVCLCGIGMINNI